MELGRPNVIPIGIGELYATAQNNIELVAYGLGSCIGVVVHDRAVRTGGMVHVLLPARLGEYGALSSSDELARYADTGVRELLDRVVGLGASRGRLVAKIAGGARMFQVPAELQILDIGARNAKAVRAALDEAGVPLVAHDVGGKTGRTMRYLVGSGKVYVREPGMAEREL